MIHYYYYYVYKLFKLGFMIGMFGKGPNLWYFETFLFELGKGKSLSKIRKILVLSGLESYTSALG